MGMYKLYTISKLVTESYSGHWVSVMQDRQAEVIPWPVPGGWADEACTYCWVLVGLIWVLISRMPSLANLSPLYKHRSRNVISPVENSAVKLMRGCRSLMLLMNCCLNKWELDVRSSVGAPTPDTPTPASLPPTTPFVPPLLPS